MKEYFELFTTFFKMGAFTFGGGYAMLPMLEKEIIEKRNWATNEEIMDYFAIGQVTPGIIAVNTATFIGYKRKGILGGIIATLGIIMPSIIIITIIASLLTNFSELPVVQHALSGIRIAVCILMFFSIIKLFKGGVKDKYSLILFVCALILAVFTNISTVILVIVFGSTGVLINGRLK